MSDKQKPKPRIEEIRDPLPHYIVEDTEEVVKNALYRFKIKPSNQNGKHATQDDTERRLHPQSGD